MPRKNPCSTTPGTARTEAASAAGSDQSSRRQSRIALPSSVTKGRPSARVRRVGSQPRSRSSRPHTGRANSTTSTGSGASSPSRETSLRSSATTTISRPALATTFSRRWAPPRPLIRSRPGSISSAPSITTSSSGVSRERRQRDAEAAAGGGRRIRGRHAGHVAQARRRRSARPAPRASLPPSTRCRGRAACRRGRSARPPPRPAARRQRVDRAHAAIAARTAAGSVIGARHANRSQM